VRLSLPAKPAQLATVRQALSLRRIAIALGLLGLLLRLAFALLPLSVHLVVLEDDAWMVTAIARNLATGHGISADGMHATNGFQPLYPLTLGMLPYLIAPDALDAGFRVNLLICAILNSLAVWPLWSIARRLGGEVAGLLAVALFALNPLLIANSVNAMETSLGVLLLLTLLAVAERLDLSRPRNVLLLALLSALATLARLDAALAFGALTCTILVRAWRAGQLAAGLRQAAGYVVATLVLLLPYFAFNYSVSHTLEPSSGLALAYMHSFRQEYALTNGLKGLFENSAIYLGWISSAWLLLLVVLALAALLVVFLGRRLEAALPLLLVVPGPLLYYGYYLQQDKWRYFIGISAVLMILLAWLGAELLRRWPGRRSAYALAAATLALLVLDSAGALREYTLAERDPQQTQPTSYQAALWIRDHLPPDAIIGAKNSGIYQYYSGHTVLNIDGKLNAQILPVMEQRSMLSYLRAQGVSYLVDRQVIMEQHITFYSAQFGPWPAHHMPSLLERVTIYGKMAGSTLHLSRPVPIDSPDDFHPARPFADAATIIQAFTRPNQRSNPVVVYQLKPAGAPGVP